jgi:hypothetical protein
MKRNNNSTSAGMYNGLEAGSESFHTSETSSLRGFSVQSFGSLFESKTNGVDLE